MWQLRVSASVVHAKPDSAVHARKNNSVMHADADDYDGDAGGGDDDDDDDANDDNEVKQQVWLVDPTLFFPNTTPPPKVEVWC